MAVLLTGTVQSCVVAAAYTRANHCTEALRFKLYKFKLKTYLFENLNEGVNH